MFRHGDQAVLIGLLFVVGIYLTYTGIHFSCELALSKARLDGERDANKVSEQLFIIARREHSLSVALQNALQKIAELETAKPETQKQIELAKTQKIETMQEANLPVEKIVQPAILQLLTEHQDSNRNSFRPDTVEMIFSQMYRPHSDSSEQLPDVNGLEGTARIPVVVFTYSRHEMLSATLEALFSALQSSNKFAVFVSQDGTDFAHVTSTIRSYGNRVRHMIHRRSTAGITSMERLKGYESYYAIAHHYKWAIDSIFHLVPSMNRVIVLEEDLKVAPDFFTYFDRMSHIFDSDETLYCVSAWNDNGKGQHVHDPEQLYRSDFFPGLGWMTSRTIWEELSQKWAAGFWDDWMRQPGQRKGRTCIRPEISRTYTIGSYGGASAGAFYRQHLAPIALNTIPVDWNSKDIAYVENAAAYERWFNDLLNHATEVGSIDDIPRLHAEKLELKLFYNTRDEFITLARRLNLMSDFKDGVPRTAFKGIVSFREGPVRIHLIPRYPLY